MTSMNRRWSVSRNIVWLAFLATLIFLAVSVMLFTKYSLMRFKSYLPELNPGTDTWSHNSWIRLYRFVGRNSRLSKGSLMKRLLVSDLFARTARRQSHQRVVWDRRCIGVWRRLVCHQWRLRSVCALSRR